MARTKKAVLDIRKMKLQWKEEAEKNKASLKRQAKKIPVINTNERT